MNAEKLFVCLIESKSHYCYVTATVSDANPEWYSIKLAPSRKRGAAPEDGRLPMLTFWWNMHTGINKTTKAHARLIDVYGDKAEEKISSCLESIFWNK